MSGTSPPYIARRATRQSPIGGDRGRQAPPFFRAALVVALLVSSAGCARLGLPSAATPDTMQTGSINTTVTDAVDPSDWEVVRQTIAADPDHRTPQSLAWQNPRTGSYGTLDAATGEQRSGGVCRVFTTTVNDLRGVRRYRGEACQPLGSTWQLTGIVAADKTLL